MWSHSIFCHLLLNCSLYSCVCAFVFQALASRYDVSRVVAAPTSPEALKDFTSAAPVALRRPFIPQPRMAPEEVPHNPAPRAEKHLRQALDVASKVGACYCVYLYYYISTIFGVQQYAHRYPVNFLHVSLRGRKEVLKGICAGMKFPPILSPHL